MPAVRYGPGVSDDAAYIMNRIVRLQDLEADLKRAGRKLSKRDRTALNKEIKAASDFFGVSKSDINKRKFGDMGILASYSQSGINLSRRKRGADGKWEYQRSKRAKFAKRWRDGTTMRRGVTQEHERRGASRTLLGPGVTSGSRAVDARGGGNYLGLTNPKKLQDATDRFYKRVGKKGPIKYGSTRARKIRNEEDLDRINIAKRADGRGPARSIRPRLKTSRPGGRKKPSKSQRKRVSTVKAAGKTKKSTAKGPKRPRRS